MKRRARQPTWATTWALCALAALVAFLIGANL